MEKRKHFLILGTSFLWLAVPSFFLTSAGADSYKYIDRNGTIHFTDRYESIPGEYRGQVKTIREESKPPTPALPAEEKEKGREKEAGAEEQAGKIRQTQTKEAAAVEARKKEIEEKKQKEFEEKARRIADLKNQIEEKRKQQQSLRTNWMVHDRNTIIRLDKEITVLKNQINLLLEEIAEEK